VTNSLLQIVWLAAIAYRRSNPPPRSNVVHPTSLQRWYEANWILDIYDELGSPPYPIGMIWSV